MQDKVLKSSFWYTISNFLISSINILTTPIFSRILTLEEFGAYNNFITILNILNIVSSLNLQATLNRAKYDFIDDTTSYIKTMIVLGFISTLFCSLVTWIINFRIVNLLSISKVSFIILSLTLFFSSCS